MLHFLESILYTLAPIVIVLLEVIGVVFILYGAVSALVNFALHRFDLTENKTKILLGEAFALALEFKLGSEIIKTVVVRSLDELLILGIVVVLRVVLTFVIHWEIHQSDLHEEFNVVKRNENSNILGTTSIDDLDD